MVKSYVGALTDRGGLYVACREAAADPRSRAPTQPPTGRITVADWVAPLAAQAIRVKTSAHRELAHFRYVGHYAGYKSEFAHMTPHEQRAWLIARNRMIPWTADMPSEKELIGMSGTQLSNLAVPERVEWTSEVPKSSDCINWVKEVLGDAYAQAGQAARWREIRNVLESKRGDNRGTVLLEQLQRDGWIGIYFNPDVVDPAPATPLNRRIHLDSVQAVTKTGQYYGLRIADAIVNYRLTATGKPVITPEIARLRTVPLFVGIARAGEHAFLGRNGYVSELHWDANPDRRGILNEIALQDYEWSSGTIVVPPASWAPRIAGPALAHKIHTLH